MIVKKNNNFAFTVAEILIVLLIISIIAIATTGIDKVRSYYTNKFMYYAAVVNLQQSVGNLIADGCLPADVASGYCLGIKSLPYNTSAARGGFCKRLADVLNIQGSANCAAAATSSSFIDTNLNFATNNGQRYFNLNNSISASTYYVVYIDIDGKKGSGTLNKDVFEFHIYPDGRVYPAYNSVSSTGPNSTTYLSASSIYYDTSGNTHLVSNGVTYYQAVCDATGVYDPSAGSTCSSTTNFTTYCDVANGKNPCSVILNKPSF